MSYTTATGLQASIRPDTYYYYDLLGQLVGVRDANTNVNTQAWRTGPDGKSMVVQEWHADLGVKKFGFDVFGNRRYSIDEEDRRTDYTYDAQGQLILVERPVDPNKGNARSTERYEYDQLGYRIASVDALGNRTKTYYDVANRVTRFVSPQGRATMNYAYTYDSTLVGIDGTVAGGWVRTTTNAANLYTTDKLDVFDRVLSHRDFGGHQFTYTYNKAGLISSQQGTSGQSISYAYYGNGLLASVTDNGAHTTSTYQYDKDGNRTREMYAVAGGTPLQNAVIQYDALNRVTSISGGDYEISYEYDAVGNRRRVYSKYTDGLGNTNVEQDYWYAYDAMNRFKVTMGQLAGARGGASTTIVAGTTGDGVQIVYDKAGQRQSAIYAGNSQTPAHTENYAYDANGYLTTVTIGGVVRAERVNDAAGRVVRYIERNESNSVRTDVTRTWDADGLQTGETDNQTGRTTQYHYSADGTLETVATQGGGSASTTTTYTYEWWDSAKQKEIKTGAGWGDGFSRFTYDVNGNLKSATDVVGKREFRYLVDGDGQVLRRDEYLGADTNPVTGELESARGNRSHSYYYLGGHRVGNVGNDGVERVDYAQELSRTTPEQTKAEDYYKRFKPSAGADFDENYMPINSTYPGASAAAYTVRSGDTLRSIATSLWGDASLWWMLADANGLSGDDALVAGTVLRVPNKVTNVHNTSETYRPYDPGKALGNTSPTLPEPPPPPGRGGCGGMGQILSVVVAVVATIYTAGLAASVLAPGMAVGAGATAATAGAMASGAAALAGGSLASAAIGGAVGALAGQVTAMATGVQDKFSWTGVALGAVGAGVTAGLGQAGLVKAVASAFGNSATATQAALGGMRSAATQGIGVVTGLQSSFDWKGVAASAIAGGVAQQVGGVWAEGYGSAEYMTRGLAAGMTSALVRGQSLSRNIGNIAFDVIGATVGNALAENLSQIKPGDNDRQADLVTSEIQRISREMRKESE
ncbi:LysM peptidoglycan-binding domain-containing protein, partial [Pigmentiphaga sp. GD03639]|uniref:LysM peptidoglycan-binding domain-containing protein n=1 Tax=Pigmentiphaga sp. GD03639 TaxID=2975354 RepID=UPI0024473419